VAIESNPFDASSSSLAFPIVVTTHLMSEIIDCADRKGVDQIQREV
jgi:hypothetical protein